jgi:pilus assembly protein FimV
MAEGDGDSQDGARDVAAIHAATQPLQLPPEGSAPETNFTATDMMPAGALGQATSTAPLDLDLDLDFSDSLGKPGDINVGAAQDNQAPLTDLTLPADIDSSPIASLSSNPRDGHISLDLGAPAGHLPSLPDFDQHATANLPLERAHVPSEPAPLEFDLGGLSLDLDPPTASATPAAEPAPTPKPPVSAPATLDSVFGDSTGPDSRGGDVSAEDALATKLALAEEFQAIGDDDGARTLAQEVADAATGNLKAKAQRFLTELG